jgi:hypothetical protein
MVVSVKKLIACMGLLWLAQAALADNIRVDMKPGLWQNTMNFEGDAAKQMADMQTAQLTSAMAEMKKQMAAMPPEQRKQMEAIMAQSGVSLSDQGVSINHDEVQISSKGTVAKNCITQAQIDRGELNESDEGCSSSLKKIGANHFKSTQVCQGEDASNGHNNSEMEIKFDSPKHYRGKGTMTQTVSGKTHVVQMNLEGIWLGSDCGKIKPEEY